MAMSRHRPKWVTLGYLIATPGAKQALHEAGQSPFDFLARHQQGDWGIVCEEDKKLNEEALEKGYRVLSAYTLRSGVTLWVITEGDRSTTTLLLPEEY